MPARAAARHKGWKARPGQHAGEVPRLTLFPKQAAFVNDLAPVCAAVTGLGGAKTISGAIKVLSACDAFPGLKVLISAPTFTQLKLAPIRSLIDLCAPSRIVGHNQGDHVITLTNGCEIYYQSADDYDHFRGPEYGLAWMDEAAYCSEQAYLVMLGRVRQPYMPQQVIFTTTPAGKNWVYRRLIERPVRGTSVHHWTTRDNPFLPASYVQSLEDSYSGTDFYAQELGGEFVSFEGLVYQIPERSFVDFVPPGPYLRVHGGIDFGSTNPYAHATAAYVIVETLDGRLFVVAEFHKHRAAEVEIGTWLAEMTKKWGVRRWEADRSQFTGIGLMRAGGVPILPTPPPTELSVLDGITITQNRFATGGLFIVRSACPKLLGELSTYSWQKHDKPDKAYRQEPIKVRDDGVDALRYGVASFDRKLPLRGRRARKVTIRGPYASEGLLPGEQPFAAALLHS